MPFYLYECQECGQEFEVMESYEEEDQQAEEHCPVCGSSEAERASPPVHAGSGKD